MSDAAVLLVGEVHGRGALASQLGALLRELADASREEPGCDGFRVLMSDDPGEFVLLSSWSSEAAMRAHYDTGHYRQYRDQVGPLLARASDVVVHHLSSTVHALDPIRRIPACSVESKRALARPQAAAGPLRSRMTA